MIVTNEKMTDVIVLLVTFILTIVFDLVVAIPLVFPSRLSSIFSESQRRSLIQPLVDDIHTFV